VIEATTYCDYLASRGRERRIAESEAHGAGRSIVPLLALTAGAWAIMLGPFIWLWMVR
jgi:hypothetical protein